MTTPLDVLSMIRRGGGSIRVEDGDLRISSPAGLLTLEHKAVLVENKDLLLRLLAPADQEREAIAWVEGLSPAEATTVVETARQDWKQIVDEQVEVVVKIEIEAGRDRLERLLADMQAGEQEDFQIIDCPPPCPQCDSLRLWQAGDGNWRCLLCDPPVQAERLAEKARRLRGGRGHRILPRQRFRVRSRIRHAFYEGTAMKKSAPEAPSHLSREAAQWWDRIVSEWELDDAGLLILQSAMESYGRAKEAEALVVKHGILLWDRFDQEKLNPAVLVERDCKSAMLVAFRQLHLDLEPLNDRPGRPAGR